MQGPPGRDGSPGRDGRDCEEYRRSVFYRQLDFSSQPEVVNRILENTTKSCLTVA